MREELTKSNNLKRYNPRYRDGNPIWKYFTVNNAIIGALPVCKTCGSMIMNGWKSLAGNTTNMRQHLRNKHLNLFEELVFLCEEQKNRYDPKNWAVIPYVCWEEIFKKVSSCSFSVSKVNVNEDFNLDPPSRPPTPPSFSSDRVATISEPGETEVLSDKSFQEQEAALRLELLRTQIRREKARAEFYEIQTKEIQQRLVSTFQSQS